MPSRDASRDPVRDLLDEESLANEITKAIEGNDCPADKELKAYIRRELKEPERIEVKSHLSFCGRCQKRSGELAGAVPASAAAAASRQAGTFLRFRLPIPLPASKTWMRRAAAVAAGILVLGIGTWLLTGSEGEFPYSFRVIQAPGETIHAGQQVFLEVETPRPIYLIEIIIDGDGKIAARVSPGPREGMFSGRDRLGLTPRAPGELDLYLVPCQAGEGYPSRLLNGLMEFFKTQTALSRANQRTDVEVALGLYHARFLHQVLRIAP